MGAATPITIGEGGGAEPVEEKMVSYFRTEMATTARAKGRRGDIAEAMVDKDVEIKGISPAGKLLTLDTAGALKLNIADAKANTLEDACALLALGGATVQHTEMNWAEKLARIFTDPMLSSILMSIGVLGILIELYHPGVILPGAVGVICLLIFFAGHLVVNLAGWEEGLLFLLGLILLGVEIFVTPGFGVLGIAGILAIVTSLVLAMTALPIDVSFSTGNLTSNMLRVTVSMAVSLIVFLIVLSVLPKAVFKSPLILHAAITATAEGGREGDAVKTVFQSGMTGIAESFLRPAGIARFGDKRIDVSSEGDFIESGSPVEIVRVHGNRVTVRKKA
jgi:membrane-bound serine protease (ClpP class)